MTTKQGFRICMCMCVYLYLGSYKFCYNLSLSWSMRILVIKFKYVHSDLISHDSLSSPVSMRSPHISKSELSPERTNRKEKSQADPVWGHGVILPPAGSPEKDKRTNEARTIMPPGRRLNMTSLFVLHYHAFPSMMDSSPTTVSQSKLF